MKLLAVAFLFSFFRTNSSLQTWSMSCVYLSPVCSSQRDMSERIWKLSPWRKWFFGLDKKNAHLFIFNDSMNEIQWMRFLIACTQLNILLWRFINLPVGWLLNRKRICFLGVFWASLPLLTTAVYPALFITHLNSTNRWLRLSISFVWTDPPSSGTINSCAWLILKEIGISYSLLTPRYSQWSVGYWACLIPQKQTHHMIWNWRVEYWAIRSFARSFDRTAHSVALIRSLAHYSFASSKERDLCFRIESLDFIMFQPTVGCIYSLILHFDNLLISITILDLHCKIGNQINRIQIYQ